MNPKSIFNLFSPKEPGQTAMQRQMFRLVMSLMALLLLALTACAPVAASEPAVAPPPGGAVVPATPAMENEATTGSAYLATNPELLKAHPSLIAAEMSTSTFLANNPELMMARRDIPRAHVDPNGDLGLLEFFTVPDGPNDRRAIERHADEDIGLLEFFRQ